jgi:DNA-binding NarL/FixJ family response regulator
MKPISILLVDDNPIFLQIITDFLRNHYCQEVAVAGVAHSGQEALRQARQLQPQVVLLDLAMPDMSGLEVIPLLQAALPAVGIIILTAHNFDGYRELALATGADAFVPKAQASDLLWPVIRQVAEAKCQK